MFSVLNIKKTFDRIRQRCLNHSLIYYENVAYKQACLPKRRLYVVLSYLSLNRIKHVKYVLRLILWPNFLNTSTKHINKVNLEKDKLF